MIQFHTNVCIVFTVHKTFTMSIFLITVDGRIYSPRMRYDNAAFYKSRRGREYQTEQAANKKCVWVGERKTECTERVNQLDRCTEPLSADSEMQ